jgi:hypothetical protein
MLKYDRGLFQVYPHTPDRMSRDSQLDGALCLQHHQPPGHLIYFKLKRGW